MVRGSYKGRQTEQQSTRRFFSPIPHPLLLAISCGSRLWLISLARLSVWLVFHPPTCSLLTAPSPEASRTAGTHRRCSPPSLCCLPITNFYVRMFLPRLICISSENITGERHYDTTTTPPVVLSLVQVLACCRCPDPNFPVVGWFTAAGTVCQQLRSHRLAQPSSCVVVFGRKFFSLSCSPFR